MASYKKKKLYKLVEKLDKTVMFFTENPFMNPNSPLDEKWWGCKYFFYWSGHNSIYRAFTNLDDAIEFMEDLIEDHEYYERKLGVRVIKE